MLFGINQVFARYNKHLFFFIIFLGLTANSQTKKSVWNFGISFVNNNSEYAKSFGLHLVTDNNS